MKTQALSLLILTWLLCWCKTVKCEYEHQPKIQTHDGTLILEAARDRNITVRLSPQSTFLVNNIDVLHAIKQELMPLPFYGLTKSIPMPTVEEISDQVKELKRYLRRLNVRFTNMQNGTRSSVQPRRMRRVLNRIVRSIQRLTALEQNLSLNECEDQDRNPCKNGGTCYDAYMDFHCECPDGWMGKTCEDDVDECYLLAGTDLGCQNNALCVNTLGSYRCSCRNGYTGTHCRFRYVACEVPQLSELCKHGVCVHSDNEHGYTCICDQGWTKNNATPACSIDVNECESATNPCHSECVNLPGSFKCGSCPRGYTGNGVSCLDIDECAFNNGGCSLRPPVACINTEGGYHCGNCPVDWVGDGHTCEPAPSNSCDAEDICHPRAKCEYISGTAVCTCPAGMYGHGFGASGCTTQVLTNPCENHECKNNGTCLATGRGTSCVCPLGFMGALCEQTDACQTGPCQNGGTCTLLPNNKFRCTCARGFTGNNCEILRNTCGAIIAQESGELSYPPDSDSYEPNERCAWIIRTENSKILNVTFSTFDLEAAPDCGKDWLQIHDGRSLAAQLIGRFCGKSLPLGGNIVSSHQQLFFWFRSDNATNGVGFNMSWTSHTHICGGSLELNEGDSGVVRSPGYPGKTAINRECEWEMNAPFGQRLLLRFYEVNLGGNENCTRDVLKVYDSDMVLKSICETSTPEPLHTSSNKVRIHFHTDAYRTDSSFQLHYEVVPAVPHCGGIYTEPSGIISGYMNAEVCLYLIQQLPGTKVRLEFTSFDLLPSQECALQKLEVFDGNSDEDPLMKRLCGHYETLEPLISNGKFMLLRYEYSLSGIKLRKQFEAKYSRVCEESFFGPDNGSFTTPNYPNPYFDYMTCTYNIYGPLNTVVHATFTQFSLTEVVPKLWEDDEDLSLDRMSALVDQNTNYVDVFLSNTFKHRYYRGEPTYMVSERNRMRIVFHSAANSQKAIGLRVEYRFETITCGGVLTESSGYFSKYALDIGASPYCEWVIEAPEGKHIQLELEFSRIGPKCLQGDNGLLIFSNSSVDSAQLLGSYCDEERYIHEPFHTNVLTIFLHKISVALRGRINYGIEANYTFVDSDSECGGNFSSRYGIIKTPSWSKSYRPSMDCIWRISAPLGHKIELVVQNFSLQTTSDKCGDNFLEIRNGKDNSSPFIGKYCGNDIPRRIPSFTNHLYLHFVSGGYISSEASFYLQWEQTATGCGGNLNSPQGSIHSPHNPDLGTGGISCNWLITVAQGSTIDLNITKIGETSNLCGQKTLVIYDGATTASRILKLENCSDDRSTYALKATTNQVLVLYTAESGNTDGLQFLLDYNTNCNVQIDRWYGVIESPNFPENYPPGMNCAWDIRGGRNNKYSFEFSHLQMEQSNFVCNYDYVEVWDMRDEEVLTKRHLCKNPAESLTTEGNRLLVKFVSDYSDNESGFRMEYKRLGCGEHFQKRAGFFSTPNMPYSVDMECDWYIEAPAGKQIFLHFVELHIDTEVHDCSKDVILITEAKNSSVVLLKECRIEQTPITVTSPANSLYIYFKTSDTRARKFFRAMYNTQDAKCGGIFRANSGLITSPNYPDGMAANVECVWTITVENAYGISVKFEEFNITESTNCANDFLEIKRMDGQKELLLERACGQTKPLIKLVHGHQMSVTVKAGPSGWDKFAMRFQKQCGGPLVGSSGYMKSSIGETCVWEIQGSEGSHITVQILHLECQCEPRVNCTHGIRFYNNYGENSVGYYCGEHKTDIVFAVSTLRISATEVNFRAKYSTVQNFCGGALTSLRGILASPYYPASYPSNVECIWVIIAAAGSSIELDFEALDIAQSEHCNEDFLEVREGERGKLLGLYCANEVPTDTLVGFERVWIKFRSVEGSMGNGFQLKWSYAHTNEINGTGGNIAPPPLTSIRNEEPYSWRIFVARGQLISINFKEYTQGLNLYDGFDEVALKIDIPYSPWQFYSSSNVLLLTSNNADLDQFNIAWSAVSIETVEANKTTTKCHEEITIPFNGYVNLSSPGYPHGYSANLKCTWIIKAADPMQHVVFNLFEARLEKMYDCQADNLRVLSSSNLQDWQEELKICSSKSMTLMPVAKVQGTPFIKLEFNTDASLNGTGFTSLITTVCGANLTSSVGTILDRSVLLARTVNSSCLWHIDVRPGKRIVFTFDYGRGVATKETQCHQYAILYDGWDEHAPILSPGHICNQVGRNVKLVESSTNRVTLKYNVSRAIGEFHVNLWNMTYREFSECDSEVYLNHFANWVNISSPRYPNIPHPHTECFFIVIAPPGETLQAEFVDRFDMNQRYCSKEFVELFDGSTVMARSLGRYCFKPGVIRTTGNILALHYFTDIAEPRNGFRANISIALCGGTFTQMSGELSSKNYPTPGAYPKPAVCEYAIKIPSNARIRLNFTDLHLPFDAKNEAASDRLEIVSLGAVAEVTTLFGNTTEVPLLEIDSNEILIRFTTFQGNSKYRGFKLKYERKYGICYRDVTGDSGMLVMYKPNHNSHYITCRWKITVPKGQRVRLELLDLEGLTALNNTDRFLSTVRGTTLQSSIKFFIFNDHDSVSKITEFDLASYNAAEVIQSSDNYMYVRMQLGLSGLPSGRIKARYSSDDDSLCPPDIADSPAGLININAILSSKKNFYCHLQFTLSGEETITFKIKKLETSTNTTRFRPYALRFKDEDLYTSFKDLSSNISGRLVSISSKRGSVVILQSDLLRILSFSASYRRHACGGIYTLEDGVTLDYPSINEKEYGQMECVWSLKGDYSSNFYKLLGNASFTDTCEREYVVIYFGITVDSTERARICRDNLTAIEIALPEVFTIITYHVEDYTPGQSNFQFRIEKSVPCNSKSRLKFSTDVITVGPKVYKNNMECSWEFEVNLGMYLSLNFMSRFFIEDSANCSKDYLELNRYDNGLWIPEARFCGREVPTFYNVTSNRLLVVFRTNEAITGDGFSFRISRNCISTFNVSTQTQIIYSPTFGNSYFRNIHCEYTFQSDSDKLINVRISDQRSTGIVANTYRRSCEMASITAFKKNEIDGAEAEENKYCINGEVRAQRYLRLNYDAVLERSFKIEYELNSCGGNISSPTTIRHLQHEDNDGYADNMECIWYVVAPPEHSVIVRFKFFEMERQQQCKYDYVAIYEGLLMTDAKLISHICGNLTADAPVVVVDSNQAIIAAMSDSSNSFKGFLGEVLFMPNCNEHITLTDGNSPVTLVRHFKITAYEELLCHYRIMTPPGYRVSIQLKHLHLNAAPCPADQCGGCNHIQAINSVDAGRASMGKYCSNDETRVKLLSSNEDALLVLRVTTEGEYNFEILLQMEQSNCDVHNEFELKDNEIVSIKFPSTNRTNYPPNTHCTWVIKADKQFQIEFNSMVLQNASEVTGKCKDYVHIKGYYVSKYFCGNATGLHVYITHIGEASATITFHSDESTEASGFHITAMHRSSACNRTYTSLSGLLQYSYYDSEYKECTDEIRVPDNYTISLYVTNFFLTGSNCTKSKLEISDINTNKTLLERCRSSYSDYNLHSTTNAVRVHALGFSFMKMFYVASNKTLPPGCGGDIYTVEGQISSPPYNDDRNHSDCRWDIVVPAPNKLRIWFPEFNMGVSTNCHLDYVNIFEVAPNGTETLTKTFCGQDAPDNFETEGSHIAIVSKKSPVFDGTGWTLAFDTIDESNGWQMDHQLINVYT